MRKNNLTIRISDIQRKQLEKLAKKRKIKISEVLRELIDTKFNVV